jgi:riboflavin kinase / FMN adenylyltransferase
MATVTLDWHQLPSEDARHGALSIGNFDGVHHGHAALVAELRRHAELVRGPAIVLTFDPHPLQMLRPDRFQPVLTTLPERARLLHECGADHVIILRTTPELLHLSANDFFDQVIRHALDARAVVEGPNFGFGRDREGTVDTLAQLCERAGIRFKVVDVLEQDGQMVSSSRVRAALLRGDVRRAAGKLGRFYQLHGKVGTGQRRGRTIGFPTANIEQPTTLVPGDGVYAVRAHLSSGEVFPGAANVGPNPTFGEHARKVEVHLIGFSGDLYDQPLTVEFVERLRDTRPFGTVAELVEQLRTDVEQARQIIADEKAKS